VPFRLKLTLFASAAKKKTFRLFAPSPPGWHQPVVGRGADSLGWRDPIESTVHVKSVLSEHWP
jgi:hypothetical protein